MIDHVLRQFGLQMMAMNKVEDSFSSTVYKCTLQNGENVYVKIPYTKLKFQRELEAYGILQGSVRIPALLDYWPGDETCPGAFLLSELKGAPLTPAASAKAAYEAGVLHAKMHAVRPPAENNLQGIKNEFPDWTQFVTNQFYSFAEDVKALLDPHLYHRAINRFEKMIGGLPAPDGPGFVHMDFRPANILTDGDQVTGVIDFESVRFGAADMDFTKLYRDFLSFDMKLYHSYKDGYDSIRRLPALDVILPFYRFVDAFNSIGWCKRRGIEKNARFLEENLVRLKKILG